MDFRDKVVVVTGAGGSIGSEICEQIVRAGVKEIRLLSLTENGLYEITKRLNAIPGNHKIVGILGSVTDWFCVRRTVIGADIVIHAAAHKHVPICEQNPLAAIENNVLGTSHVAHAAKHERCKDFILISSDKAVEPASVMGATKRAAELILRDLLTLRYQGAPVVFDNECRMRIVRFGNVMNSAGSVLPLWKEQIKKGGPLTITDMRCERYFMSIPEAASLVLGVLDLEPAVGPFIFDMGKPLNMGQMAINMVKTYGQVEIKEIGLRPGEKLTEELTYGGSTHKTANPKILYVEEEVKARFHVNQMMELCDALRDRDEGRALQLLWSIVK